MTAATREARIIEFLPLALRVARSFSRRPVRSRLDIDDLRSEAVIGLIDAIDSYDPSRGASFRTHALTRIRGQLLDALRNSHNLSRRHFETVKANGEDPSLALDLSLSDPGVTRSAESVPTGEDIPADLARRDELRRLLGGLDNLPERERRVVREYFWEERRFSAIALRMGISESRVMQLKGQAFRRLRDWLA